MTKMKDQVTPGQLVFLIIQTQIGVGLLGLTSEVHSLARGDAWISVILAGSISQLFIFLMWYLSSRFPSLSLYDMLPNLFGKPIGTIIHVLYTIYFILVSSFIIVQFSRIAQDWVLIDTPRWIVMGMMSAVCLYLIRESLRTIARFFVIVFFCNIAVIIIAAYAYLHVNFLYILPIGHSGIESIAKGTNGAMTSFAGFEMLMITFPFVGGSSKEKLKAASIANLFTTLLYAFAVFTSLVVFSPSELALLPQPLLYMVKALSFSIFERPDLYFLSLWAVVTVTSLMGYSFMASKGIANLFQAGSNHRKAASYTILLIFVLGIIFQNLRLVYFLEKVLSITNYFIVFIIPLMLFLVSILRNKKEVRGSTG